MKETKLNPYQYLNEQFKEIAQIDVSLNDMLDPYEFIFKYAYTLDPHDPIVPIKCFPNQDYIKRLIDIWLSEHMLLVVKVAVMVVAVFAVITPLEPSVML